MGFTRFSKSVLNVSALPNRVQNQASALKATFDQAGVDIKAAFNALLTELESSLAAGNIGADISSVTTKTVQAILTAFEAAIANRYTKAESDALLSSGTNSLVSDVDVNLTTGVITVTKKDGTVESFDTALEKVPATFSIVESSGAYYFKITNVDGSSTQTDITSLMNIYSFNNSDDVAFSVSGTGNEKTVTASIRANSIGLDKLSLSAISTLEGYVASAADSASAAATSETNAKASELSAAESKSTAVTKAEEASASALSAADSANIATSNAEEASANATGAESWAVGGTGSRTGEDTNNARYWAEQARDASQGGDMLKSVYDTDGDGIVDLAANGIKVLEASTDNIIDFNTLTETGIYLIKNVTGNTTINSGITSPINTFDDYLFVSPQRSVEDNSLLKIYQYKFGISSSIIGYRILDVSSSTWINWSYNLTANTVKSGTFPAGVSCNTPTADAHLANKAYVDGKTWSASKITAGTLAGKVLANATAVATLTNSQIRNIKASTTDLTAGTSALTTGDIYIVYE